MLQTLENTIKDSLRDVPDFPKPGIVFKDITPILGNPVIFNQTIEGLIEIIKPFGANAIAGIEARGFVFGAPVAAKLNLPFIPVRKPGKLPWKTRKVAYALEYGEATIEVHEDALECINQPLAKVAIIDDLLATGGTTQAACKLISSLGGEIVVCAFVVELGFLNGRQILKDNSAVCSLARL